MVYTQCIYTALPSESGRSKTENCSSGIAAENLLSSGSKSVAWWKNSYINE